MCSEARIASFVGKGFYTIGPCGEEMLGTMALNLQTQDITALHYRHLATSVGRQLLYDGRTLDEIALARARGFACSTLDPVTGGRHCSIGGHPQREFLVTSTLASQVPPAVGRALAIPLSQRLLKPENAQFRADAVSVVSVGDGSINNAHFLAGINLAKYASHNRVKCPAVFVVSDNNICISLKGTGYTQRFVDGLEGIVVEKANGLDFLELHAQSQKVIDYARKNNRPALLYIHSLPRRFGHAATDRQFAYHSPEHIQGQIDCDPLSDSISQLVQLGAQGGVYAGGAEEVRALFHRLQSTVESAFDQATEEAKVTDRDSLQTSAPLPSARGDTRSVHIDLHVPNTGVKGREVMRKQMTRVFDEILSTNPAAVYLGEDVTHGGYYVVTETLAEKYPGRVRDFPPDETTLVGAAMGFSQAGLLPILEIPYAKYLDCAADMFYESAIAHWLSRGQQNNGMVIRLQGFDKGIFGGNFHTHNMLNFPPGLDVVCFSNGRDYVRGMRYLVRCAQQGRVVMSVDSTDLLNRRHLVEANKDEFFLHSFPENPATATSSTETAEYNFDQIVIYDQKPVAVEQQQKQQQQKRRHVVLVTYGNGVPTSILAGRQLQEADPNTHVTVLETPCLSQTPQQLVEYFQQQQNVASTEQERIVVFADVCKYNPGMPLALRALELQDRGLFQPTAHQPTQQAWKWTVVGAANTYNPLGTYLTFLSTQDILQAVQKLSS